MRVMEKFMAFFIAPALKPGQLEKMLNNVKYVTLQSIREYNSM